MAQLTYNNIIFSNVDIENTMTGVFSKFTLSGNLSNNVINVPKYEAGKNKPFINAIDIDWNGAQVSGTTLNTTGEVLSVLQTAYNYATTYNVKYSDGKLYDDKGNEIKVGSTLSSATTTTLGGIKTGYTTNGKNYAVSLDENSNAFVNVPWTDTTLTVSDLSTTGNVLFLTGTPTRNNGDEVLTNLNTYNIGITTQGYLVKFDKDSTTSHKAFIHTINGQKSLNGEFIIKNVENADSADTAYKVAKELTIQYGTYTTTFDGSYSYTVNITPAAIGAATTSHKSTDGSNGIADSDEYGHVKLETFETTDKNGINVSKDYSSYTGYALSLIGAEILFNKLNENIADSIKTVFDIYLGDEHTSFSNSFKCNHRTIGLSYDNVLNAIQNNNNMFEIPCYITNGYNANSNLVAAYYDSNYNYERVGKIVFSNNVIKIPMDNLWVTDIATYNNLPPLQVIIPTTKNTVAATGLSINPNTVALYGNDGPITLTATRTPSDADGEITWTSQNGYVNFNGNTTATGDIVYIKGNPTESQRNDIVTATLGNVTAICNITVNPGIIKELTIGADVTSGSTIASTGRTINLGINSITNNIWGADNNDFIFDWEITSGTGATLSTTENAVNVVSETTDEPTTPAPSVTPETKLEGLPIGASVQLHVPANTSTTEIKSYEVTVTAKYTSNLNKTKTATYTVKVNKKVDEITYYWYAGQTEPTDMSSNPTPDDTNFTNDKWHTLAKDATSIAKTITGGTSGKVWYVAVPTSFGFKPTSTDLTTPDNSWSIIGTIIVDTVEYTLWQPATTSTRCAAYMAKI